MKERLRRDVCAMILASGAVCTGVRAAPVGMDVSAMNGANQRGKRPVEPSLPTRPATLASRGVRR